MRRVQPDGVCACCGAVGPTWADVERAAAGFVTVEPERAELPPLCDGCEDAQARWEAGRFQAGRSGAGYPYREGPPRTPPVRR
jgi:hypothetical protein